MPVLTVLLVSQPLGLLLVAALALGSGAEPISPSAFAAAAAGGIAGALALGAFFQAMAEGPVSIVAPVSSLGAVIPVAVGLARGENPAALQFVGLVVALAGIGLAVREVEHPGGVDVPTRSIVLAALAGLGFGAFFVGLDAAASENALWAAVAGRTGGSSIVLLAALAMPGAVQLSRAAIPALCAIALLDTVANTLFALASRSGLLSLVAVAGSLYPVATVILARIVLAERLAATQRAGVVLALGGVALIAAG